MASTKITQVVKSSSFLFAGTVEGLTESHLKDSNVQVKAIFYATGKYNDESAAKVEVAKANMTFDDDVQDAFTCYVDTTTLPTCTLSAAIEVKYPSPADESGATVITEIVPVTFANTVQIVNL